MCNVNDIVFEDLKAAGITYFVPAITELDRQLSKSLFMTMCNIFPPELPIFIFVSDGCFVDEYKDAIRKLKTNKWFRAGHKIGFVIGDDAEPVAIRLIFNDRFEKYGQLLRFSNNNLSAFKDAMKDCISLIPQYATRSL